MSSTRPARALTGVAHVKASSARRESVPAPPRREDVTMPPVASNAWSAIAATGVLRATRDAAAAREIAAALAPMLMLMHCSSRAIAATTVAKAVPR